METITIIVNHLTIFLKFFVFLFCFALMLYLFFYLWYGKPRPSSTDLGPFRVLVWDDLLQDYRPMQMEDFLNLEAEVNLLQEEFWARLERDALMTHGHKILLPQ